MHQDEEHEDDVDALELRLCLLTRSHVGNTLVDFPKSNQLEYPKNSNHFHLFRTDQLELFERCHKEGYRGKEIEGESRQQVAFRNFSWICDLISGTSVHVGGQEASCDVDDEDEIDDDVDCVQDLKFVHDVVDFAEGDLNGH